MTSVKFGDPTPPTVRKRRYERRSRGTKLLLGGVCLLLSPTLASCALSGRQADNSFDYRGYYEEVNRGTPCPGGATADLYSPSRTKVATAPLVQSSNESVTDSKGRPLNTDDLPPGRARVPRKCGYLFEFAGIPSEEGTYTINITRDGRFLEKQEGERSYLESLSHDGPMPK